MGDNNIRREAERAAAEALKPRTDASVALAVAELAARQAPKILEKAKQDADAILAKAKQDADGVRAQAVQEVTRLQQEWARSWQAALDVGWEPAELTAAPLHHEEPPKPRRRPRRAGSASAGAPAAGPAPRPGTGEGGVSDPVVGIAAPTESA
ncbi:hypothetical protein [Saccharothrix sp.]|uniref:hypothetical protein n=1 Tax=Saccharothrix sp. TaxID=1873460 RepID=UPI0028126BA2|nr:hypothetical protein [Saccharothrix sp.]